MYQPFQIANHPTTSLCSHLTSFYCIWCRRSSSEENRDYLLRFDEPVECGSHGMLSEKTQLFQEWHELVPLSSHYLPEDLQVSHLVITTTSLSPRILAVLDNLLSALAEVALHMPPCVVHELQLHIILNNDCMHARVLSGCKSAGG